MANKKPSAHRPLKELEPIQPETAEQAFMALKTEIEGVPQSDLIPINVDVASACTTGLGAAKLIEPLLQQMLALPDFDPEVVTKLQRYALAALFANTALDTQSDGAVAKLLIEAAPLRENLLVAAEALAHRELLAASRVAEIRSGQGHLDTANDLIALAALFRESWASVAGKTTVTREEFERAAVLGSQLHAALGARRVGADARSGPSDLYLARERAFTLFVRAYDQCRRAISFVRWNEGDFEEFAPSIYARRRRRSLEAVEPETPGTDLPPTVPAVVPAVQA